MRQQSKTGIVNRCHQKATWCCLFKASIISMHHPFTLLLCSKKRKGIGVELEALTLLAFISLEKKKTNVYLGFFLDCSGSVMLISLSFHIAFLLVG